MSELTPMIKAFLFEAGTQGRRQREIFKRFQYVPQEELLTELQALWSEERVQRFTVGKTHVWRATDKFNV